MKKLNKAELKKRIQALFAFPYARITNTEKSSTKFRLDNMIRIYKSL